MQINMYQKKHSTPLPNNSVTNKDTGYNNNMRSIIIFLISCIATLSCVANDNEVVVVYDGNAANVSVAENIKDLVTVSTAGADVTITQSELVTEEVTYRLSGSTDNGSFVHKGDFKITLSLEGLQLTSQTGAAMQIKNGKRIAVVLKEGTTNQLTDKEGGEQKGCMIVKGHSEFEGAGMLTIHARGKHAYKGDEYVLLKKSTGQIDILCSGKDGIHLDDYLEMKGGILNITTTGSGYWDEEDQKTKAPSCINTVGDVVINGGKLTLTSTGDGGKCIKSDAAIMIKDGEINATTTGARYIYEGYEGDKGDIDNIPDDYKNSPKAIAAQSDLCIDGGMITIRTTQDGGEGLESKNTLTINDGTLQISTYDDCVNSAGDLSIHGGTMLLNSLDNDGLDTNQNMYITGGNIITLGNYLHELGIDVNDKSPYKKLYVTGGNIVCVSGTSQVSHPYECEGAQAALYYKGKVAVGTELSLVEKQSGKEVLAYTLERDYKAEAGGQQPDLCVMFSSPEIVKGQSYTLFDKGNEEALGVVDNLEALYAYFDANSVRFSRETFSLASNTLPYRKAEVCHTENELPALLLYLHGGTSRGDDNEAQLAEAAVDVIYNYLKSNHISATMIVPQCPLGSGWTSQNRKVVNELLKNLISKDEGDANRVYVVGGSMGGTGTWCQLSNFPNFYAAAMPVAGNPTGMNANNVATTPVLTVMGTADNMMSIPAVEEFRNSVMAAGGYVRLDIEEGWSHPTTCEQSYTEERLDWLFSQTRDKLPSAVVRPTSTTSNAQTIYDLQGRSLPRLQKGINIIGNKKCVIYLLR